MTTDIFLSLITGILVLIQLILAGITSLFNFVIPSAIFSAFNQFFGYVRIGDGIFPFNQALAAVVVTLTVWGMLYFVKVILFAFSLIPVFGKVVHLPNHHSEGVTESESYNSKGDLIGRNRSRRSGDSY
jgi:hypothetical protein